MFARARVVKTRESVAKSRNSVNEKNARLAWRIAYTTPCGCYKWKGRVELDGPRKRHKRLLTEELTIWVKTFLYYP